MCGVFLAASSMKAHPFIIQGRYRYLIVQPSGDLTLFAGQGILVQSIPAVYVYFHVVGKNSHLVQDSDPVE